MEGPVEEINNFIDNEVEAIETIEKVSIDTTELTEKLDSPTNKKEGSTDNIAEVPEEDNPLYKETTNEAMEPTAVQIQHTTDLSISHNASLVEDNGEEDQEEGSESDDEDSEESEDDEIETEMTLEEKQAMYEAVKCGDIDAVEDCLDKPNSDVNFLWFKENLLMAAIRHGHEEMAKFLLDNGVDHAYSTSVMEMRETPRGILLDKYDLSCRQMAYDYGFVDVVQMIDHLEGNLFPFVHPPERTPRQRRQRENSLSELDDSESDNDDDVSSSDASDPDNGKSGDSCPVSGDEAANQNDKKIKKIKKRHDDRTNIEADIEEKNDNESDDVLDNKLDNNNTDENEYNFVRKKRKQKTTKDSNNIVDDDKVEKREVAGMETDSRQISAGSASLTPAALPPQMKSFKTSNQKLSLKHEQGKTGDGTVSQKKTLESGHFPREVDLMSQSLEGGPSPATSEQKLPKIPQRKRRNWSSKSVPTTDKANRRPSDNDLEGKDHSNPLRWEKVSTTGSYISESRRWHRPQRGSSGESTVIGPTNLSKAELSALKNVNSSFSLSKCVHNKETGCSACSTNYKRIAATRLSEINNSATKTSWHIGKVQQAKHKATKKKISPRFMNSYEVLEFIPHIRTS